MKYILFLLSVPYLVLSQQKEPAFLTTFYFRDAIGNQDSMEIGFDLDAQRGLNIDFGEVIDRSPFDSIFDVRAVNYFEFKDLKPNLPPNIKLKRIVGGAEKIVNAPCLVGEPLLFFIKAIHQPITISWRIQDFEKINCPGQIWNFFSPDELYHLLFPHEWIADSTVRYGCMSDSSYTFFLGDKYKSRSERSYILNYDVQGKGIDSIYGVAFIMDQSFFYCDPSYVDGTDIKASNFKLNVYPNPSLENIFIEINNSKNIKQVEVINQYGVMIHKINMDHQAEHDLLELNTSNYPQGIYYVIIVDQWGRRGIRKFIKV
ncbi:MAG: T9SS type A sorting domain-containing protein [Saprospiraceae bacterium]|nr:T9SS type A sorting domain-containing protein [Candidatus Defluviibacterium haderslevense]